MDEKERNYCCLVLLLNRVGLVKLRHFFIYQWDSCSGCLPWTDSLQNGAALLIKYTPLYYERDKVKSGDTTTWDLSLFVKTLLYSTPPLVPSYETALVDGLKYLKDTRDLLCHTQNGKIESSTRFQDLFKDACNALKLLGASKNDFTRVENGMCAWCLDKDYNLIIILYSQSYSL
ncbi:hypothetical protein AC249_AIPGENE16557 [Exaiptasia diaphana]|nr:hypothetical protein AC249_AIPGENE16557 [Exaiptasia diaphana]